MIYNIQQIAALAFIIISISLSQMGYSSSTQLGKFDTEVDLFLPQFDSKTDVDDIHSVAAVATMLADTRFDGVRYHAVAGAYGRQEGLYVPANELFNLAFGDNWSDAHDNFKQALDEVSKKVNEILKKGGDIWIAEAGQSDFSAGLIKKISSELPDIDTLKRIHLVQHSEWNENSTTPDKLDYVKQNTCYHKIPDGNIKENGSPGFKSDEPVKWKKFISDRDLISIWNMATNIAEKYNGKEGRYNNPAIANGGLDFSDVAETCWIFGFETLTDAEAFFSEFTTQ